MRNDAAAIVAAWLAAIRAVNKPRSPRKCRRAATRAAR